jgi:small-conductance mechanosensitive channel
VDVVQATVSATPGAILSGRAHVSCLASRVAIVSEAAYSRGAPIADRRDGASEFRARSQGEERHVTAWLHAVGAQLTAERLIGALALVLLGFGASWIARRMLTAGSGGSLDESIRYSLSRLVNYVLFFLTAIFVLSVLGVDVTSIAVAMGGLGIGLGFGLQTIASNFVSGLILLFERPIRVGDRISLSDPASDPLDTRNGFVRAINLRATVIETVDNLILIVPNSEFVNTTIINWSQGEPRIRLRLRIGVAYSSDIDQVTRILLDAARAHPGVLDDPAPDVYFVDTADSALEFQLLAWIGDMRMRRKIESDLRYDIVRRFRTEGVSIPFPQRDVYLKSGAGQPIPAAPPAGSRGAAGEE